MFALCVPVTYLLLGEPLHDVRNLLPAVHRLLILLLRLEQHQIEHGKVLDCLVLLKLRAELGAKCRRRHFERVESADLRGLKAGTMIVSVGTTCDGKAIAMRATYRAVEVAVERRRSLSRLLERPRDLCSLGQSAWDGRHSAGCKRHAGCWWTGQ